MKKILWIGNLILLISLVLYLPASYSQGTLRERLRDRWLERKRKCGDGLCEQKETKAGCPQDCDEVTCRELYKNTEQLCLEKGWEKLKIDVNGIEREMLWKTPQTWKYGAIIAMHGGEGVDSNFCASMPRSNNRLLSEVLRGVPVEEFGELALKEGFAVFSLNSTYNRVTDVEGRSVGKRWDSLAQEGKENIDLPFIEKVMDEVIPSMKPSGSSNSIFVTGISNGGFMTILASTHFSYKITAFAPVSAGDPYGTYFDMSVKGLRKCGPGVWRDSETNEEINHPNACASGSYTNEAEWPQAKKSTPFKQFHNKGDGGCDFSCMKKAQELLVEHGYQDEGAFIIDHGKRNAEEHFWQREYNRPMIEFFKKYSGRTQDVTQFNLGPGDYDFTLVHGGIKRKYKVHLPPNYDKADKTPVVIYLHGGGGSLKAAYKDGMDKASDKFGFILVIPAGSGPIPDRLLTWNAGKWPVGTGGYGTESCCGYAVKNNIDDVGFISKVIEEVKNKFKVDEKKIYATGISNGGMMSYRLACELSDKIAAIAPVAPPAVPMNCVPSRPVPVMHIHGTRDPCAPYDGGTGGGCLGSKKNEMQSAKEMVDMWMNINKCSGSPVISYQKGDATCISYNKCAGDSELEFCTIEGGGHTWPSGSQYLSADKIGPVSYDISFDQIWKFFSKHPMK